MVNPCPHAAAGCNYPEGECAGHCEPTRLLHATKRALIYRGIVEQVAAGVLHARPADCRCRQCELIREARAALNTTT